MADCRTGNPARSCPCVHAGEPVHLAYRHPPLAKGPFLAPVAGSIPTSTVYALMVDTLNLLLNGWLGQSGYHSEVHRKAEQELMLIYEYKLHGSKAQYAAIDEAIRIVQFIRNKCLRLWMDSRGTNKNDLQCYCSVLAKEVPFAARLNSQTRQAAADRAWVAISRFYDHCKQQKPGKKGYPRFQHDNRSVEYKQTGWKMEPDGKHITFTDGCTIGRLRLVGNKKQKIAAFPTKQIKRVRLIKRADGYFCQFAVRTERCIEHVPTGKHVGIDMGLSAFLTDSDGNTVENPCYLRRAAKR